VKTTPRAGARPSTRSTTKIARFTILRGGAFRGHRRDQSHRKRDQDTHPDFQYQPIAAPEELGNCGRVKWVSGRLGDAPSYAGTDFIIAQDGRIAAVYLFFDKLP
jgi:hypothetical protein